MYMLLLIYSVFNMNDVSWGTREVAPRKVRPYHNKCSQHHSYGTSEHTRAHMQKEPKDILGKLAYSNPIVTIIATSSLCSSVLPVCVF